MRLKILFLLIILIFLIGCNQPPEVCFENGCFQVEVADTLEKRQKGLMFRESLDSEEGILYVFPTIKKHPFWMKNTLIPLDIIWFSEDQEIVFISENTQPCQEDPCLLIPSLEVSKFALEVSAGSVERLGLKEGDKAEFKI